MVNAAPLLLLGGALKPAGADCMDQAAQRGVGVVLADTRENLDQFPDLAARAVAAIELPYSDPGSVLGWLARSAQRRFLGVYGTRETAVESVAAAAELLGLPGNGLLATRRIRDKAACRAALVDLGFRQPPSALCADKEELREFMAAHGPGPWIIKPPTGRGSAGVSLVRDDAGLDDALAHLADAEKALAADLTHQGIASRLVPESAGGVLIEGFQAGQEFSAEGVFVDRVPRVLALTSKISTGPPHFVELGHSMPADLPAGVYAEVARTLACALTRLELCWGAFHVEFWLDENSQVVLGEVHTRPGGDYIHVMAQHVSSVQMHGVVLDQLLGVKVDATAWAPVRGAAVRFLTPPPGVVTAVDGWADVIASPHFLGGKLTLAVGTEVGPLRSSFDRSSFVCATGANVREAAAVADRLAQRVRITVRRTQ